MNGIISKGGKPVKEENEVNEGITQQGVEYTEQEWDIQHRPDNMYPNLDVNFAKFMEEDLEGPYMFEGESYFCLLYTSPSPRDQRGSGLASSA
mgnify:CR=1 FL=1